jgi:hypothetical protein
MQVPARPYRGGVPARPMLSAQEAQRAVNMAKARFRGRGY